MSNAVFEINNEELRKFVDKNEEAKSFLACVDIDNNRLTFTSSNDDNIIDLKNFISFTKLGEDIGQQNV